MNRLTWLSDSDDPEWFPAPERALKDPEGLLAAGGDLSPRRLLSAYAHGIFPWYAPSQPILWWSPDPRMVLFPAEFRCSRSLAKTLRNGPYRTRLDGNFAAVIRACSEPRRSGPGTWLDEPMMAAYGELHRLGHAHSVETYVDDVLVGGLYGVHLGGVFFGESMFSRARDASKAALARLVQESHARGIRLIDCQVASAHLNSLGARDIPRREFLRLLRDGARPSPSNWAQIA